MQDLITPERIQAMSEKFDRIMGDPGMAHRINAGSSQPAGRDGFIRAVLGAMDSSSLDYSHNEGDTDVIITLGNYAGWFPSELAFVRTQMQDLEQPQRISSPEWSWVHYSVDYAATIADLRTYRPYVQFGDHYFWDE